MTGSIPITKAGAQAIRDELRQLIDVERPAISQAIGAARELGDLKENAEYHSAKDQQGLMEARISFLQDQLQRAQIIDITKIQPTGTVLFGTTVTMTDLSQDKTMTVRIVGEQEADLKSAKLSVTAPLARACIGKRIGDVATVETPSGAREYEIEAIAHLE